MTRQKKILLVDDSRASLMVEEFLLDGRPYDLLTARDGEEAVAKAESEQPDLIVMDVVMPRLDGLAACRKLRANAATRAIPVIMVTTLGHVFDLEAGYESGCTDYVTKPINGVELLSKIEHCLDQNRDDEDESDA